MTKPELKTVSHPQPYKVSWVNSVSIDMKERCLVSIQFVTYSDKIWYNVVTMDVGHIILGRPWLFDMDITIYGRSNSCSFVYDRKKVKLAPLRPAPPPETKQTDASSNKKTLTRISLKIINKKIAKGFTIVGLVAKEITHDSQEQISPTTVPI